jgi:hypothetical protein
LRAFNFYLLFIVIASYLTNIILAFIGQDDLTVYFTLNVIVFLVITLLHIYLNPRARRSLSAIAVVLFGGFMVIVLLKVIDVLSS